MSHVAKISRKAMLGMGAALVVLGCAVSQANATNLVTNGDFESLLVAGTASEFGSRYSSQQVTGWSTSGYNFVFTPGSASGAGAMSEYGSGLKMWSSGNGGVSTFASTSPSGGNFIGADGAYFADAITQSVSGLTVGQTYSLSFYWAAGQQYGFSGATTDKWTVSLGGDSFDTSTVSLASHDNTSWMYVTHDFVATATTETLSFLATGTPTGVPPFAFLDGVSLVAASGGGGSGVPEPATMALLMSGLLVGGSVLSRRRNRAAL